MAYRGVAAYERGHDFPVREERLQHPSFMSGMVLHAPLRQTGAGGDGGMLAADRAALSARTATYLSQKPRGAAFSPLPLKEAQVVDLGWFRTGKHSNL